jgi:hypothetical protein
LRPGPLLLLAVHLEIHLLVEEAQVAFDLVSLRDRLRVVPDEVLHPPSPGLDRVVRSHALVRAPGVLIAREEHLLADVLGRDVVARRQSGLEEDPGPLRLGDDLPVHADLDVTGAIQDVDPVVRIAGVDEDFLVLLEPGVYLVSRLLTTFGYGLAPY